MCWHVMICQRDDKYAFILYIGRFKNQFNKFCLLKAGNVILRAECLKKHAGFVNNSYIYSYCTPYTAVLF